MSKSCFECGIEVPDKDNPCGISGDILCRKCRDRLASEPILDQTLGMMESWFKSPMSSAAPQSVVDADALSCEFGLQLIAEVWRLRTIIESSLVLPVMELNGEIPDAGWYLCEFSGDDLPFDVMWGGWIPGYMGAEPTKVLRAYGPLPTPEGKI